MKWINTIAVGLLLPCCVHSLASTAATHLIHYETSEESNKVSINFKFDKAIKYHLFLLSNPDRLVIDFNEAKLTATLPSKEGAFIKKVRHSDRDHELRLVLDLKQKYDYSKHLSDQNKQLTIELRKEAGQKTSETTQIALKEEDLIKDEEKKLYESAKKNIVSEQAVVPTADTTNQTEEVVDKASEPLLKVEENQSIAKHFVIVIDPGHGGKDSGAQGPHGALEKDVVLKISKQLQAMLNEEPGFSAVLTRTTDYFIPLRKRLSIARKNHADMFIAIHADAYSNAQAAGSSVYALSPRGATSEAARWLAEKENESELGGLGNELADKDAILRSVLIDLSQTHTIESSLQIGNAVLGHLSNVGRLHHPRVEQAAFVVLKSPDIPSLLVETGFLSNPLEEEKLLSSDYQYKTALAIKEGIKKYFKTNMIGQGWFVKKPIKRQENQSEPIKAKKSLLKKLKLSHRKRAKHED